MILQILTQTALISCISYVVVKLMTFKDLPIQGKVLLWIINAYALAGLAALIKYLFF